MNFKGILFDYGNTLLSYADHSIEGTLARNLSGMENTLQKVLGPGGPADIFLESFQKIFIQAEKSIRETLQEIPMQDIIQQAFQKTKLNISEEEVYDFYHNLYHETIRKDMNPDPEAMPLLRELNSGGIRTGLVSNSMYAEEFHREELEAFGFLPLLDPVIFSSTLGVRKPHPDIFQKALNEIGLPPEDVVFVGDHLDADIGGAKKMGIRAILRHTGHNEGIGNVKADAVIHRLGELTSPGLFTGQR